MRAAWWWIDRWRKSTAFTDMTAEEQGVYRNLLDELWLRDGVIPLDERALTKISGDPEAWPRVRDKVLARFEWTPHGYRNTTHDEVSRGSQAQAEKGRKRAAQASRAGGKFTSQTPAAAPAENQPPSPSPSPSPTNNGNPPDPPAGAGGDPHVKASTGLNGQVERLLALAQARGVHLSAAEVRRIRRELKADLLFAVACEASINARADAIATEVAHQQEIRTAEAWILERGGLDAAVDALATWLATQQGPEEPRREAIDRWQEGLSVPPYVRSMLAARLHPTARAHSPPVAATA